MKNRKLATPAHRGMSLLEIMVVLVLIGLLAGTVGVAVFGQLSAGQEKAAMNQANSLSDALQSFKLRVGKYPTASEGLNALANPPKGQPFIERVPKDPWGNDYIYVNPGVKNRTKPDVRSKGEDGQENTEDDVGNWPMD